MKVPVPSPVFHARLEHLTDGDSGYLRLHRYFGDEKVVNFRLLGIDCPERYTEAGKAATAFAFDWFAAVHDYEGDGRWIENPWPLIAEISLAREKYGRTLLNIWRPSDGENLVDALFVAGHGRRISALSQMEVAA